MYQDVDENPCGWLALLALLGIGLGVTLAVYVSNPEPVMQGIE